MEELRQKIIGHKTLDDKPISISDKQGIWVSIEPGDVHEPQVIDLIQASEDYANRLYPPESVHILSVDEFKQSNVTFLIARDQTSEQVLGCGALVLQQDHKAELKRMFVQTDARRRGIGALILQRLEQFAHNYGVQTIRLETGVSQPEAIRMYERFGYAKTGPFGNYTDDPLSIFMYKPLIGNKKQ